MSIGFVYFPATLEIGMPFLSLNTFPIGQDPLSDEMMALFLASQGYVGQMSGTTQLIPLDLKPTGGNVAKVKKSYHEFAKSVADPKA
jgi:hypothetical protein